MTSTDEELKKAAEILKTYCNHTSCNSCKLEQIIKCKTFQEDCAMPCQWKTENN